MEKKSEFYTLNGYRIKNKNHLTESMEDYLEMIYREYIDNKTIHIKTIANKLNVQPSSASKMMTKLKEKEIISFKKYGEISLTPKGETMGRYLLWRHNTLVSFFTMLNKTTYQLEQVEKIEHFIDYRTLKNMEKYIKKENHF